MKLQNGMTIMIAVSLVFCMIGCAKKAAEQSEINVISREAGSGTRGAFVELFGIEQKVDGKKIDFTADTAEISNSTEVVITSVSTNIAAIGYISLGSLNKSVKALTIDGSAATIENIKNNTYKIARPFCIVTKNDVTNELIKDFIRFILSEDGQAVIAKKEYIPTVKNPRYIATGKTGKITIAGSSSVFPVMEKLAESYKELNEGVTIEVSQSDSTTGVTSAAQGVCDIGMSSRELKQSEESYGITATVIAMDGIAVIVNKDNPLTNLSKDIVKKIYTGEITSWKIQ